MNWICCSFCFTHSPSPPHYNTANQFMPCVPSLPCVVYHPWSTLNFMVLQLCGLRISGGPQHEYGGVINVYSFYSCISLHISDIYDIVPDVTVHIIYCWLSHLLVCVDCRVMQCNVHSVPGKKNYCRLIEPDFSYSNHAHSSINRLID